MVALILPAMIATGQASELRVGFSSEPLALDPGRHRNRETETILRNMHDGLVTRKDGINIVPQLAKSWRIVDPLTYEFVLHDEIYFHNGKKMHANDVKFTFDRLIRTGAIAGKTSPRKNLLGPLKEVRVVDERRIHFILDEPWPPFLYMLPFQQVVCRDSFLENDDERMAFQVNGTGPFRFVEWRKGDSVIMERFDRYYGGSHYIPPVASACVDRLIFKIIPYTESRVAGLLAGDVDIINEVPYHAVRVIERTPGVRIVRVNGTRSFFIALNNQGSHFQDIRLRKAVAHAIDKTAVIDSVLGGNATPVNGILSSDTFVKSKHLVEYAFDTKKTRNLMIEAGYPEGIDVTLDVEPMYADLADVIARQLIRAGIRTKIHTEDPSVLKTKWRNMGKQKKGDMWLTSWGNSSLDPVGIFPPTHMTGARGNAAGYSNPRVDLLLEKAGLELMPESRAELYAKAEHIVNRDLPYIYLWIPQDIYGISERVKGWKPGPDSRINLHDVCVEE